MKRRYRIARALFAEFRYEPHSLCPLLVEWDPQPPQALRGAALRAYRKAREKFGVELAKHLGRPAILVESFGLPQEQVADLQLALCGTGGRA